VHAEPDTHDNGVRNVTIAAPGQFAPRLEDGRFLTGTGQFVADMDTSGHLFAYVVRSEHAHARIASVDVDEALALDGVVAVHTESDLARDNVGCLMCPSELPGVVLPPRRALVRDVARHVGDPIALVIAKTAAIALEAAELVVVDYDALPAAIGSVAALCEVAPQVWPQAPGNLVFSFEKGDGEGVAAAMASARHVVELEFDNTRVSAAPMEPRAGFGAFDPVTERYTLTCTAQGVHGIRDQLAKDIFGVPAEQVRVVAPDVGGGFGLKNFLYPEWVLLLWAAKTHGQMVYWEGSRVEEFTAAAHGRDMHVQARLALDENGGFLALDADVVGDMGAYLSGNAPNIATRSFTTAMGGIYKINAIHMTAKGAFTNTGCVDAYRGAGKPEANFLIERLIDAAAARCGFDPLELRRKNAIESFPHRTAFGMDLDGGRFGQNVTRAGHMAGYQDFSVRRDEAAADGQLRGIGIGCFLETARGNPSEGAEVRFLASGDIEVCLGTESNGQGHETTFTQLAAHFFGVDGERIRYVQADTDKTRMGHGHGGARSMHMGGGALSAAMDDAITKGRKVAAQMLQADVEKVSFYDGCFASDGTGQRLELMAVAFAARDSSQDFGLGPEGMNSFARRDDVPFTFPNGCHIAEVQVDPETGSVELLNYVASDDYGTLINPVLTEGQVHGGVVQGIGQALGEHVAYDAESGQLISATFMDYYMPRADLLPQMTVELDGVATAANPLGVKGSGQAGCIVATQTIVNAVVNALSPLGVDHIEMPLTPERVWHAIRDARSVA
jgi:aerobic carbon-monoxide dehydrogenase large subunit